MIGWFKLAVPNLLHKYFYLQKELFWRFTAPIYRPKRKINMIYSLNLDVPQSPDFYNHIKKGLDFTTKPHSKMPINITGAYNKQSQLP